MGLFGFWCVVRLVCDANCVADCCWFATLVACCGMLGVWFGGLGCDDSVEVWFGG